MTNGNGVTIDFDSNALGQTVGLTDALGNRIRTSGNLAGETTGVRDARGNWSTFILDEMGAGEVAIDRAGQCGRRLGSRRRRFGHVKYRSAR